MQNDGVAARDYLTAVVSNIDVLRKQVSELVRAFCEQFVPTGADGQVERVAQRFGLVAAGGEIAVRCGVVPWQGGKATLAAGRCFEDWLAVRGGIEPAEAREGIDQVRSFLLAIGMARFIPAWEDDQDKRIQPRDVALAMYLDEAHEALRRYKTGDRTSDCVVAYFRREGLEGPLEKWRAPCPT